MEIMSDGDFGSGGYAPVSNKNILDCITMSRDEYERAKANGSLGESHIAITVDEPTTSTIAYKPNEWDTTVQSSASIYDQKFKEIWDKLNTAVTYIHKCKCCGAELELPDDNKGVFHCKFCNATYAIGTLQFNSTY